MAKKKITLNELRDIMENSGFSLDDECEGQAEYVYTAPCGHEDSVYVAKDDVYESLCRAADDFDIDEYVYDGLYARFKLNDATVPNVYQLTEDGEAFLAAVDNARIAVENFITRKKAVL